MELEPAGAECASGGIGCGTAVAHLPAEDGDAGTARGCDTSSVVLHTPTQADLGWGTRLNAGFSINSGMDAAGTGSACFRCYGRWRAGLQLGFGTGHFSADRSRGHEWKHGAAGRRVWRPLEIDERGQPEFQSCFGHMAAFD